MKFELWHIAPHMFKKISEACYKPNFETYNDIQRNFSKFYRRVAVANMDGDIRENLEMIFKITKEKNWNNTRKIAVMPHQSYRPTTIGDVVIIPNHGVFICSPNGWSRLI
jgi:hypothetical protein